MNPSSNFVVPSAEEIETYEREYETAQQQAWEDEMLGDPDEHQDD